MKHKIELTIELEAEYEGDTPDFYFEEHRCADDYAEQVLSEIKQAGEKGTCTCHRMRIKYVGPVTS